MFDELKELLAKFLRRERDELRKRKKHTLAWAVGLVAAIVLLFAFNGDDAEEIDLSDAPPVTKDLPVQKLPAEKISARVPETPDGVKIVLGANSNELYLGDPFQGKEKPKPPPKVELPPIPQPTIPPPPQAEPKEKILLTGTAISGDNKTAMFLRGKETIFVTVGERVGGRQISDITPDFVSFTDGKRVYIQKELD